jgi:SNF2 family DNA or RNA helicase
MAQYCYLLEPCLDIGLEAQAQSRISRFGQTRPTTAIRVRMKDTVEEHILTIAEKKVHQTDIATGGEHRDGITISELARMFDVDVEQVKNELAEERRRPVAMGWM